MATTLMVPRTLGGTIILVIGPTTATTTITALGPDGKVSGKGRDGKIASIGRDGQVIGKRQ